MNKTAFHFVLLMGELMLLAQGCTRSAHADQPQFRSWPVTQSTNCDRPILGDLEAHGGPRNADYRDTDATSWAHELTHYVNALIRNRAGGGYNAFYLLDNRCVVLHEPRCTLADVAARTTVRGPIYQTYLVQQQHDRMVGGVRCEGWNKCPLNILDEMTAYTNGAIAGRFTNSDQWQHQRKCAVELSGYAKTLVSTVQRLDPGYTDLANLQSFIAWNDVRILEMK